MSQEVVRLVIEIPEVPLRLLEISHDPSEQLEEVANRLLSTEITFNTSLNKSR